VFHAGNRFAIFIDVLMRCTMLNQLFLGKWMLALTEFGEVFGRMAQLLAAKQ